MKKLLMIIACLMLTSVYTVQATEKAAGCGLGAIVLEGKDGKGANIAAALLNNIVIPNTTFMTTGDGLMGCDPTQTVQRKEATKIFLTTNMDQLSMDAAKGKGNHMDALAYLLGVQEKDNVAFQQMTQNNFDQVFRSDQADHVLAALNHAMLNDLTLSKYVTQ